MAKVAVIECSDYSELKVQATVEKAIETKYSFGLKILKKLKPKA